MSWVVKYLLNNFVWVLSSDYSLSGNYSVVIAFKVFILHARHWDSTSFIPLKKHAAKQFKHNLCWHFNTFIDFPHFCIININQFHFRWNIIRFYLRRREIKIKLRIQEESLTSLFGLPFQAAFTLSILLPIIPFWSS